MMEFKKNEDLEGNRKKEQMAADYDRMKADIDYIAMMSDVDLTENEDGGMENE